jgi:wyosine [tRNA(Phe)-imidazoG37] synthetase (radical SAM superfamily)
MLINQVNDSSKTIRETARFVNTLKPNHAYLLIPTRPPAELWVEPPDEQVVTKIYYVFKEYFSSVTLLIDFPVDKIPITGHLEEDILAITSVHPVRQEEVNRLLEKEEAGSSVMDHLLMENKLIKTNYKGNTFYVRKYSD